MRRIIIATIFITLTGLSSCKKLVTVAPPTTEIESRQVFNSDATASAAVSGIYSRMMDESLGGFASGNTGSMTFLGACSADELIYYSTNTTQPSYYMYGNALQPTNTTSFWSEAYQYIYTANACIEGLSDSNSAVSTAVRSQMIGESEFIRAFCHFYLTNVFGDVPLITTTDYVANRYAKRTAQSAVYAQIITDLKDAESRLNADYSVVQGGERVRPIKWAAAALLARVYLYTGDWMNAESQATMVINTGLYSLIPDLTQVFLKNSQETIWSLRPVLAGQNTSDAQTFLLTAAPSPSLLNVSLQNKLLSAFEAGDKRRSVWVDSLATGGTTYYFPYKYRVGIPANGTITEYSMVLRFAEQYLIRSEARAEQGNLSGAASDLDLIRSRAGLGGTTAATQGDMLTAILHERQTELFTEWGHRWLDIKRTNSVDSVMTVDCPLKNTKWTTTAQLWPIPLTEIQSDNQLTQNPGY